MAPSNGLDQEGAGVRRMGNTQVPLPWTSAWAVHGRPRYHHHDEPLRAEHQERLHAEGHPLDPGQALQR